MKAQNFWKSKATVLIIVTGIICIMTSACRNTEVIYRNGPDIRTSRQQPPPETKPGPPPWAPAHGRRAKYRYYYYPASQVYYNESRGSYIYFSNGTWNVSVSLPDRIRIDVNDYVALEMDTDRPYKHHAEVVRKYPPGQAKKDKKRAKGRGNWL